MKLKCTRMSFEEQNESTSSKYRLFISMMFCDRMASVVAMVVGIVATYLFDPYDLELKRCRHVP